MRRSQPTSKTRLEGRLRTRDDGAGESSPREYPENADARSADTSRAQARSQLHLIGFETALCGPRPALPELKFLRGQRRYE